MSTTVLSDGASLHWVETPAAAPATVPFFFQHGMGGDLSQPVSYLQHGAHPRMICVDARGHGGSSDVSQADATFDRYADDVVAVADQLGVERFAVGGISLGAATAGNLALRHPDRVSALVLCRPAWLNTPQAPFNQETYRQIADLLETEGAERGALTFAASQRYRTVLQESDAAAASLVGQFTRSGAERNAVVLRAFPAQAPASGAAAWASLQVPTLVIGHHDDPFHPFPIAQALASSIAQSQLVTVASKDADAAAFRSGIRTAICTFLQAQDGTRR